MPVVSKKYNIKIFQSDGFTYIETVDPASLRSAPSFSSQINGGFGECKLDFNRAFDDFSEGNSIDFMNIVKIYAVDTTNPTGRLIYTGFISKYRPYIKGADQGVEVTLLGLVSLLQLSYYKNGGSFDVDHVGDDPKTIFEDIINHFNSKYSGTLIKYSGGNLDAVGTTVDVSFSKRKWLDCLKTAHKLASAGWWWKIAEDGEAYLQAKPASATHTFTIGKDVESFEVDKTSEGVINDVTVNYDGGTSTSANAGSKTTFGVRESVIDDTNLKDAAAGSQRASKEVNDNKDEKISASLVINAAYDIESVKVGQTCKIRNLSINSNLFNDNMQIVKVDYNFDKIKIELEAIKKNFGVELNNFVTN